MSAATCSQDHGVNVNLTFYHQNLKSKFLSPVKGFYLILERAVCRIVEALFEKWDIKLISKLY